MQLQTTVAKAAMVWQIAFIMDLIKDFGDKIPVLSYLVAPINLIGEVTLGVIQLLCFTLLVISIIKFDYPKFIKATAVMIVCTYIMFVGLLGWVIF